MTNKKEIKKEDVFTEDFIENMIYSITKYVFTSLVALGTMAALLINFGFSLSVGESMLPTIPANSVLITKHKRVSLNRGSFVNFKAGNKANDIYIKRVIGKPGDIVSIKNNGVYVNGERLVEGYTKGITFGQGLNYSMDYEMKENEYYLLGDNRENSTDSRNFGAVQRKDIIGEVVTFIPVGKIITDYGLSGKHFIMIYLLLLLTYYYRKEDRENRVTKLRDISIKDTNTTYY